ncbi:hypothetical protein ZIOFF_009677 [Zingiber officinale]|uniref:Uncharacterized protein n=1 Tax=Zingiber officinale TaxID=94328 RepID=A0A8J5LJK3_ZINOF|nr:hypothetical protein ZIOFF_009677 [Zingiber officinale]
MCQRDTAGHRKTAVANRSGSPTLAPATACPSRALPILCRHHSDAVPNWVVPPPSLASPPTPSSAEAKQSETGILVITICCRHHCLSLSIPPAAGFTTTSNRFCTVLPSPKKRKWKQGGSNCKTSVAGLYPCPPTRVWGS